ncbi:MAG: peptidylprolyl isomerase [Hyphomicrobiales bacterium]
MLKILKTASAAILSLAFVSVANVQAFAKDIWVLETTEGKVEIELLADVAPKHVERIKTLTKEGFYNGIVFHRVIDGFMAQGGDPTGTGTGGSDKPDLPAEFNNIPFDRGIVGAARTQNPNSANSQFFIMFKEGHFLNNQYTVFGRVIEGMNIVDALERGQGQGGVVPESTRDSIKTATIETR